MKFYRLITPILVLSLVLSGCGPAKDPDVPVDTPVNTTTTDLEVLNVTYAQSLDEEMGPVNPTEKFAPEDSIYLSVQLKGNPTQGIVAARFFYGDQEITEVNLDLEEIHQEQGLIFSVGGNTQVGFTLTPTEPFPTGDTYVTKLYLNGKQAGSYPFAVGEASAKSISSTVPTQISERTVSINALWYATDSTGRAIGGMSPTRITVRPASNRDELRVGFFEEEVGGSGPMWRSAGWTAVTVASQLLGIDPRDYEFSYAVGGRIDGPSAGTYMTVGTLAALLGDTLRDDAAMTGTINPDGTVGPVGGIPQKIEGAAAQGMQLILVPAGLRYDVDGNTGQLVDVIGVGENLGVEVREVSTIFEAYELLTGVPLPRPQVTARAPQLPARAFDRVRATALEWLARYQDARGRVQSLPADIQDLLVDGVLTADEAAANADSALQQGLAAVAYNRALEAAFQMQMWQLVGEVLQRYFNGDISDAIDYLLATQSVLIEKDAVVELLRTEEPATTSDHIALFDAYTNIGRAEGLVVLANGTLNNLGQNIGVLSEDEILGQLIEISAYYVLAKDCVQLARDSVDMGFGYGTPVEVAPERIQAMSELLRRAANANVDYFETTIVDQVADAWGIHPNQARELFMYYDWDYLFTQASEVGVQSLSMTLKDPAQVTPLVLGNSISAYAESAALVAKHYSLGAELDEYGTVVAIAKERALADMLELADLRAREMISLNGDDVPVTAVLYYENARMQRQGDPEGQLEALKSYWSASTLAQVQAYLSGLLGE
ncbi:MAG: S16 family serine protease [Anaerolineae bacterium]|jgi:hypothetical protein|nr:S16 family serine protease [Anaerolineae bacterium]